MVCAVMISLLACSASVWANGLVELDVGAHDGRKQANAATRFHGVGAGGHHARAHVHVRDGITVIDTQTLAGLAHDAPLSSCKLTNSFITLSSPSPSPLAPLLAFLSNATSHSPRGVVLVGDLEALGCEGVIFTLVRSPRLESSLLGSTQTLQMHRTSLLDAFDSGSISLGKPVPPSSTAASFPPSRRLSSSSPIAELTPDAGTRSTIGNITFNAPQTQTAITPIHPSFFSAVPDAASGSNERLKSYAGVPSQDAAIQLAETLSSTVTLENSYIAADLAFEFHLDWHRGEVSRAQFAVTGDVAFRMQAAIELFTKEAGNISFDDSISKSTLLLPFRPAYEVKDGGFGAPMVMLDPIFVQAGPIPLFLVPYVNVVASIKSHAKAKGEVMGKRAATVKTPVWEGSFQGRVGLGVEQTSGPVRDETFEVHQVNDSLVEGNSSLNLGSGSDLSSELTLELRLNSRVDVLGLWPFDASFVARLISTKVFPANDCKDNTTTDSISSFSAPSITGFARMAPPAAGGGKVSDMRSTGVGADGSMEMVSVGKVVDQTMDLQRSTVLKSSPGACHVNRAYHVLCNKVTLDCAKDVAPEMAGRCERTVMIDGPALNKGVKTCKRTGISSSTSSSPPTPSPSRWQVAVAAIGSILGKTPALLPLPSLTLHLHDDIDSKATVGTAGVLDFESSGGRWVTKAAEREEQRWQIFDGIRDSGRAITKEIAAGSGMVVPSVLELPYSTHTSARNSDLRLSADVFSGPLLTLSGSVRIDPDCTSNRTAICSVVGSGLAAGRGAPGAYGGVHLSTVISLGDGSSGATTEIILAPDLTLEVPFSSISAPPLPAFNASLSLRTILSEAASKTLSIHLTSTRLTSSLPPPAVSTHLHHPAVNAPSTSTNVHVCLEPEALDFSAFSCAATPSDSSCSSFPSSTPRLSLSCPSTTTPCASTTSITLSSWLSSGAFSTLSFPIHPSYIPTPFSTTTYLTPSTTFSPLTYPNAGFLVEASTTTTSPSTLTPSTLISFASNASASTCFHNSSHPSLLPPPSPSTSIPFHTLNPIIPLTSVNLSGVVETFPEYGEWIDGTVKHFDKAQLDTLAPNTVAVELRLPAAPFRSSTTLIPNISTPLSLAITSTLHPNSPTPPPSANISTHARVTPITLLPPGNSTTLYLPRGSSHIIEVETGVGGAVDEVYLYLDFLPDPCKTLPTLKRSSHLSTPSPTLQAFQSLLHSTSSNPSAIPTGLWDVAFESALISYFSYNLTTLTSSEWFSVCPYSAIPTPVVMYGPLDASYNIIPDLAKDSLTQNPLILYRSLNPHLFSTPRILFRLFSGGIPHGSIITLSTRTLTHSRLGTSTTRFTHLTPNLTRDTFSFLPTHVPIQAEVEVEVGGDVSGLGEGWLDVEARLIPSRIQRAIHPRFNAGREELRMFHRSHWHTPIFDGVLPHSPHPDDEYLANYTCPTISLTPLTQTSYLGGFNTTTLARTNMRLSMMHHAILVYLHISPSTPVSALQDVSLHVRVSSVSATTPGFTVAGLLDGSSITSYLLHPPANYTPTTPLSLRIFREPSINNKAEPDAFLVRIPETTAPYDAAMRAIHTGMVDRSLGIPARHSSKWVFFRNNNLERYRIDEMKLGLLGKIEATLGLVPGKGLGTEDGRDEIARNVVHQWIARATGGKGEAAVFEAKEIFPSGHPNASAVLIVRENRGGVHVVEFLKHAKEGRVGLDGELGVGDEVATPPSPSTPSPWYATVSFRSSSGAFGERVMEAGELRRGGGMVEVRLEGGEWNIAVERRMLLRELAVSTLLRSGKASPSSGAKGEGLWDKHARPVLARLARTDSIDLFLKSPTLLRIPLPPLPALADALEALDRSSPTPNLAVPRSLDGLEMVAGEPLDLTIPGSMLLDRHGGGKGVVVGGVLWTGVLGSTTIPSFPSSTCPFKMDVDGDGGLRAEEAAQSLTRMRGERVLFEAACAAKSDGSGVASAFRDDSFARSSCSTSKRTTRDTAIDTTLAACSAESNALGSSSWVSGDLLRPTSSFLTADPISSRPLPSLPSLPNSTIAGNSCSMPEMWELGKLIVREAACLSPDMFGRVDTNPHVKLIGHAKSLPYLFRPAAEALMEVTRLYSASDITLTISMLLRPFIHDIMGKIALNTTCASPNSSPICALRAKVDAVVPCWRFHHENGLYFDENVKNHYSLAANVSSFLSMGTAIIIEPQNLTNIFVMHMKAWGWTYAGRISLVRYVFIFRGVDEEQKPVEVSEQGTSSGVHHATVAAFQRMWNRNRLWGASPPPTSQTPFSTTLPSQLREVALAWGQDDEMEGVLERLLVKETGVIDTPTILRLLATPLRPSLPSSAFCVCTPEEDLSQGLMFAPPYAAYAFGEKGDRTKEMGCEVWRDRVEKYVKPTDQIPFREKPWFSIEKKPAEWLAVDKRLCESLRRNANRCRQFYESRVLDKSYKGYNQPPPPAPSQRIGVAVLDGEVEEVVKEVKQGVHKGAARAGMLPRLVLFMRHGSSSSARVESMLTSLGERSGGSRFKVSTVYCDSVARGKDACDEAGVGVEDVPRLGLLGAVSPTSPTTFLPIANITTTASFLLAPRNLTQSFPTPAGLAAFLVNSVPDLPTLRGDRSPWAEMGQYDRPLRAQTRELMHGDDAFAISHFACYDDMVWRSAIYCMFVRPEAKTACEFAMCHHTSTQNPAALAAGHAGDSYSVMI